MELKDNHPLHLHTCKRSRSENGKKETKIRHSDKSENDGEGKKNSIGSKIMSWQHRIYRVSKASGGKDRHSKVITAKGLRDRRVRLSVPTAIQFYDLQDRLGFDQPSKAVEWLIKAAEAAISELPSLDFMQPLGLEHRMIANPEIDLSYNLEQKQLLSSKSGCSSNSETSKGSVLSLSQAENRVKAQSYIEEPKENDRDDGIQFHGVACNLNSHTSFTELLTGSVEGNRAASITAVADVSGAKSSSNVIQKQMSTEDYFSQAEIFLRSQKSHHQELASGFSSHSPLAMMPFNIAAGPHSELQQFSIMPDSIAAFPAVSQATYGDYNFNFSIASGLAGFNRGTLQSNSSSHLAHHHHHIQSLSSVDGAKLPFFFGGAVASAVPSNVDHQLPSSFDRHLLQCYGDGARHSDLKGKGKS